MPRIDICGVTKAFYPARTLSRWLRAPWKRSRPVLALRNVSLTVEPGELLCVMGANGAGKTTLLRLLAGLLVPTSGSVLIDGKAVGRGSAQFRRGIGLGVAEQPGFYDRLTGRQNLCFFAGLHRFSPRQARRRVDELTALFDIHAPDQRYQEYSTGNKQRLLLARTMLHDPATLLLDEPTKSLDPLQQAGLRALLKERLGQALGKTIVMTTHQAAEARQLASRVAILHRGRLTRCGSIEALTGARAGDALLARLLA